MYVVNGNVQKTDAASSFARNTKTEEESGDVNEV
jgi:hypothetical protein